MYDDFSGVSAGLPPHGRPGVRRGRSPSADQAIPQDPPAMLAEPHWLRRDRPERRPSRAVQPRRGTGPNDFRPVARLPLSTPSRRSTPPRVCATCHDVSLSHYTRQPDGSYAPATPTHRAQQTPAVPEQRVSYSGSGRTAPCRRAGRPGRALGAGDGSYSTCQDCRYMPTIEGMGCSLNRPAMRPNVPRHTFRAPTRGCFARSRAPHESDLRDGRRGSDDRVGRERQDAGRQRPESASVARSYAYRQLHRPQAPTGYGEGRRMWVNVKFFGRGRPVDRRAARVRQTPRSSPSTAGAGHEGTRPATVSTRRSPRSLA